MKFFFPENHDTKLKFLGLIDYYTIILNIFWSLFIFCLINLFEINLNIKVLLFILFSFPLFLLSLLGIYGENIIYVFLYTFKFIRNRKVYDYK